MGEPKKMSQASLGDAKYCTDCSMSRRLDEFHVCRSSPDGRQRYCKECLRKRVNENRQTRAAASEGEESSSEGGEESPEENITDLYVMRNSRIGLEYKIGRSKCVQHRRGDLQESQNFKMVLVATFPKGGWAEGLVHHRLAHARVHGCPGREWFSASLGEILFAVGRVLEEA
jgi:hypothetical protein